MIAQENKSSTIKILINMIKKKIKIFLNVIFTILFVNILNAQTNEIVKWNYSIEEIDENHVNLIIEANIAEHWHLYSQYFEKGGPNPLTISFSESENYRLVNSVIEKPEPTIDFDDIFSINVKYFSNEAKFIQKIEILNNNAFNINVEIDGQVCFEDGACMPIIAENIFKINGGEAVSQEAVSQIKNNEKITKTTPIFVTENNFQNETEKENSLLIFLLISILFGLIAILTPCVFPMIPMTVSFFMQKTVNRFNSILKILVFGISIVLLYTLVGLIISLTSAGADFASTLSSSWISNLIFFLLFAVFAASLFGLFDIVLPTGIANKADKQVDKGGIIAAFFLAITLVILSFSCTGPIIGALLVEAASGSVLMPTIGMLGFGIGFALPFTILAFSPNWIKKLPKSGGWLNSVKVVMGFIILAFSLKFLSNIDQGYHLQILNRDIFIAIWIVLSVLLGFYLLGKIKFSHDSDVKHIGFFRLLLVITSFVFALYLLPGLFGANLSSIASLLPPKSTQNFSVFQSYNVKSENKIFENVKYSDILKLPENIQGYFDAEQAFEYAKTVNKPVLLYFTGHFCSTCKSMQASVWTDERVKNIFNNEVVLAALYTDDKNIKLSEEDIFISKMDGKVKKKLGEANLDIQISNFNTSSLPYYVLISPEGKVLTTPVGYVSSIDEFLRFLEK